MVIAKKVWPILALIAIIALGLFFRLHKLESIPPGVYPDEARNTTDAIETMLTGDYKVFYPENNGREGLIMWIIAIVFKTFGISIFNLKAISATIGTLAILGTYLLTREIFIFKGIDDPEESRIGIAPIARESIALFAAGLIAVSFWHINFSRISFRAIFVPTLLSFAMWLTFRALRPIGPTEWGAGERKKLWAAIFAGIVWGAGFYTYIAFRLALFIPVFMVFITLVIYLFRNRPRITRQWLKDVFVRDRWGNLVVMFLTMAATMFPLLWDFYKHKEYFISRATGISVFDEPNWILAFLKSLAVHLQMLFFVGDSNWRHNFSGEAQLMAPVAVLFLLGVIYSFVILKDGIKHKNREAVIAHLTLMFAFGMMILPAALTAEGIPHALRAIGLMPLVFIYAAMGFLFFLRLLFHDVHEREEIWPFAFGAIAITILVLASFQYQHYFVDWGKNSEVDHAFSKGYVEIGKYFNNLPDNTQKYLIINTSGTEVKYLDSVRPDGKRLPMPGQTTFFIQHTKEVPIKNTSYILKDELPPLIEGNTVLVPLDANDEMKSKLRTTYPTGKEFQYEYFWVFEIDN